MPTNATPVISSAPTVNALRRALIRPHASLLQRNADRAAEQASEIGGEERQPREQRDLLQIESTYGREIERQPERQRAPRRIGKKPRNGDAPEVPLAQAHSGKRVCLLRRGGVSWPERM